MSDIETEIAACARSLTAIAGRLYGGLKLTRTLDLPETPAHIFYLDKPSAKDTAAHE